jgi:hypothetical protein
VLERKDVGKAVLPKCAWSVLAIASVTRPLQQFSKIEEQSNKSRRNSLPYQSARPRIDIGASLPFEQKANKKDEEKYTYRCALFHDFSWLL